MASTSVGVSTWVWDEATVGNAEAREDLARFTRIKGVAKLRSRIGRLRARRVLRAARATGGVGYRAGYVDRLRGRRSVVGAPGAPFGRRSLCRSRAPPGGPSRRARTAALGPDSLRYRTVSAAGMEGVAAARCRPIRGSSSGSSRGERWCRTRRMAHDSFFWFPTYEADGKTLDRVAIEESDGVVVMAYRNNSKDVQALAAPILAHAAELKKRVTVAIETECVEPNYVTFAVSPRVSSRRRWGQSSPDCEARPHMPVLRFTRALHGNGLSRVKHGRRREFCWAAGTALIGVVLVLLGLLRPACAQDAGGTPFFVPSALPTRDGETRCDGIDNDCDGLVDFLLPVSANAGSRDGSAWRRTRRLHERAAHLFGTESFAGGLRRQGQRLQRRGRRCTDSPSAYPRACATVGSGLIYFPTAHSRLRRLRLCWTNGASPTIARMLLAISMPPCRRWPGIRWS